MRLSWEEYFMSIAEQTAKRSSCDRLNVGCVLAKDNRIISTGYNGSIGGHKHCDDVGHLMVEGGCQRTIHAEHNAILQCARLGIPTEGATAYVTHYPCPHCMQVLNQAGIKTIYYKEYYKHRFNNHFDQGMNIILVKGDDSNG